MWFIFAFLSAVFAALTSILAKIGIELVQLATAIHISACDGMGYSLLEQSQITALKVKVGYF